MVQNKRKNVESDIPNISKPANSALALAGYIKLEQFEKVTESDLLKLHGVGPKGIRILREALKENGISFAKE
ncbi:DNA-binding protein [Cytobacillus horneckiae]|uniref:DNA-binding protein n=1 Tax=Cytobacillus horneckiae TaxID=549687 RepID=UPI0034CD1168